MPTSIFVDSLQTSALLTELPCMVWECQNPAPSTHHACGLPLSACSMKGAKMLLPVSGCCRNININPEKQLHLGGFYDYHET